MTKRFFVAAALAAFAVAPAQAAGSVEVTLDVSLADDSINHAGCRLSVPAGSDGFNVLDAAVSTGCIDSYDVVDYGPNARYLTCVDGICGQDAPTWLLPAPQVFAGTTWTFTIDDTYSNQGLDTYTVGAGDEVGLTYGHYLFTP